MYATSIEELMAVADAEELMPPKSSYVAEAPLRIFAACSARAQPPPRPELNAGVVAPPTPGSHTWSRVRRRHPASRTFGVLHQAADRHRAGTAGHRGDGTGDRLHGVEVDIALDAVGGAADAYVEDSSARLDELSGDETGHTHGSDDDVGLLADRGQVARTAVGKRRRGIAAFAAKQENLGQPDERGATDDDRLLAGGLDAWRSIRRITPSGVQGT